MFELHESNSVSLSDVHLDQLIGLVGSSTPIFSQLVMAVKLFSMSRVRFPAMLMHIYTTQASSGELVRTEGQSIAASKTALIIIHQSRAARLPLQQSSSDDVDSSMRPTAGR